MQRLYRLFGMANRLLKERDVAMQRLFPSIRLFSLLFQLVIIAHVLLDLVEAEFLFFIATAEILFL